MFGRFALFLLTIVIVIYVIMHGPDMTPPDAITGHDSMNAGVVAMAEINQQLRDEQAPLLDATLTAQEDQDRRLSWMRKTMLFTGEGLQDNGIAYVNAPAHFRNEPLKRDFAEVAFVYLSIKYGPQEFIFIYDNDTTQGGRVTSHSFSPSTGLSMHLN